MNVILLARLTLIFPTVGYVASNSSLGPDVRLVLEHSISNDKIHVAVVDNPHPSRLAQMRNLEVVLSQGFPVC